MDWFEMLPERAFRPRGFGRSLMTLEGGKGSKPPDFSELASAMRETGNRMADLGDKQLEFGASQYRQQQPLMQELINTNLDGRRLAMDLAKDSAKQELKYRALENALLDEVGQYNEAQARDEFAGQVASDVAQAQAIQRGASNRNLTRMGVNPNSARFTALNKDFERQATSLTSGAMNKARQSARDRGLQMRSNALALGRRLPQQTLAGIGSAGQSGMQASNLAQGSMYPMLQGFQGAMGGLQGQAGAIGQTANIRSQAYQNQLAYQGQQNQLMGDIGQVFGMAYGGGYMPFKDGGIVEDPVGNKDKNQDKKGGMIRGAGTTRSDSIPAVNMDSGQPIRLSNKEYIIQAEMVKRYGKEFFDKLNAGEIKLSGKRKKMKG